jgi:hypothetical protein
MPLATLGPSESDLSILLRCTGRRDSTDEPTGQKWIRRRDAKADAVGQIGLDGRQLRGTMMKEANRDR